MALSPRPEALAHTTAALVRGRKSVLAAAVVRFVIALGLWQLFYVSHAELDCQHVIRRRRPPSVPVAFVARIHISPAAAPMTAGRALAREHAMPFNACATLERRQVSAALRSAEL